jgi:NTE family protein
MTTGFVFGGAGTRGDFQVGAARLLYDRQITPAVITGSSGGAIVALKLAEGGPGAAEEADQLLRSLENAGRIYSRQPWLAELAGSADFAQQAAAWVVANGPGVAAAALPGLPFIASSGFIASATIAAGGAALALQSVVSQGLAADGLFDAAPLRQLLSDNVDEARVAASGIRLRLGVAGVETAKLRFVTEAGQLVAVDAGAAGADCAALQRDLDTARADQTRLNDELRDFVFTGTGPDPDYQALIRARNDATDRVNRIVRAQERAGCPADARINLISAALASGAMPGYFPPVQLGGELYVDGGLRSLLPIRAAIEAGATTIYAIYPKPDLTRETIQGQARMAQYLARAIDLMLEEIRMLETARARQTAQVTLIQPSPGLMIHGDLVVEPGRSTISIGYGYMCASDVVDGASLPAEERATLRTLSDLITRSRLACWHLEQFIFGTQTQSPGIIDAPDAAPARLNAGDPTFLSVIRLRKWMIGHLVAVRQAAGGAVPGDADTWSRGWEAHDWQPPTASPWEGFSTSSTAVPAVDFDTYTNVGVAAREASSGDVYVIQGNRRYTVPAGSVTSAVYPVEDGCLSFLELAGALPPPAPPPNDPCAELRADDQEQLVLLSRLNQELNALDPQLDQIERREIQAAIREVDAERARLHQRAIQLGC